MTIADEARDLLRQKRAAENALTAVRREIDEAVALRGGHIDVEAAEEYRRRLEEAQDRVRRVALAIAMLNGEASE